MPEIRFCGICKQADDHPRHVTVGEENGHHMDCGADEGCEVCAVTANPDLKGDELRAFLSEHGDEHRDLVNAQLGQIIEGQV